VLAREAQAIAGGAQADKADHKRAPLAAAPERGKPGGPRGVGDDQGAHRARGTPPGRSCRRGGTASCSRLPTGQRTRRSTRLPEGRTGSRSAPCVGARGADTCRGWQSGR
jgi:hypothetical protein